jgi:hypothetical protein
LQSHHFLYSARSNIDLSGLYIQLVTEGKCLLKNNKGHHTLYLNLNLATDSSFPLPIVDVNNKYSARYVKISFNDKNQLIIEDWNEKPKQ